MSNNKEIRESFILTEGTKVSSRSTLEMHLFDIAVEHAKKAGENVDRDNMLKMQEEMKNSLIAIVMSHFSLEALANSIGMEYYGEYPDPARQQKWKEIRDLTLTSKLKHLATVAYQEKAESEEKRTLSNSVTKLIDDLTDLRHSIVHYKAITEINFLLRHTSKDEPVSPELERYTSEAAKKAVETVIRVAREFSDLVGKRYGEWAEEVFKQYFTQ